MTTPSFYADDRAWFAANPGCKYRIRRARVGEWPVQSTKGWIIYSAVKKIPGGRMRVPFDCSAALPDNCRDKFAKRVFNAVRASDVAALRRALAPLLDEKINRDMATCALYESLGFTTVGAAAESLGQPIEFVKERVISGDLEHVMQDNGRGWISTESLARVAASQVAAPAAASSTRNSDHTSDKSPE